MMELPELANKSELQKPKSQISAVVPRATLTTRSTFARLRNSPGLIRTGDTTAYYNVIIESAQNFVPRSSA